MFNLGINPFEPRPPPGCGASESLHASVLRLPELEQLPGQVLRGGIAALVGLHRLIAGHDHLQEGHELVGRDRHVHVHLTGERVADQVDHANVFFPVSG